MRRALALKLAKRLMLFVVDESLKRALPRIYKELDAEMPNWLRHQTHPQMADNRITNITHFALKANPTDTQLELVKLLYDPVMLVAHRYLK